MGPNEQDQHFAELRQKVCLYIHALVLQSDLSSLEGKNRLFVGTRGKSDWPPNQARIELNLLTSPTSKMTLPKLYSTLHAEIRYLLQVLQGSCFGRYGHYKRSFII